MGFQQRPAEDASIGFSVLSTPLLNPHLCWCLEGAEPSFDVFEMQRAGRGKGGLWADLGWEGRGLTSPLAASLTVWLQLPTVAPDTDPPSEPPAPESTTGHEARFLPELS